MADPAGKQATKTRPVRAVAASVIDQVLNGQSLTRVLATEGRNIDPADRALLAQITYGSCRWYHRLQSVLSLLMKKPLRRRDSIVHALLICGLYQLIYMRIKPHAIVAETVDAVRHVKRPMFSKLVNGVLRSFQRDMQSFLDQADTTPQSRYSLPDWLLTRLQQAWPEQWQSIALAMLEPPPLSLRINLRKSTFDSFTALLEKQAMDYTPVPGIASAVVLDQAVAVDAIPGFADGLVSVQDAGAQLAAVFLNAKQGSQVLDACAAPGGKTCHMLEFADVKVTAVDQDESRLQRVIENLQRLDLHADTQAGDAGQSDGKWAGREYDAILLDVPCSATGVIRRHPDIKLLRRSEDISQLVSEQRRIFENAWQRLKPDGKLLYVTCSLLPEENEQQVDLFIKKHNNVSVIKLETAIDHIACEHGIQLLPGLSQTDGFYYALLKKTK